MRVWDYLHRAWLWGRKANDRRTREPVEPGTTLDRETDPVVEHRRRFWDEFREGQRLANARCDADRISDVAEPGG
jgi:hypothetical protein